MPIINGQLAVISGGGGEVTGQQTIDVEYQETITAGDTLKFNSQLGSFSSLTPGSPSSIISNDFVNSMLSAGENFIVAFGYIYITTQGSGGFTVKVFEAETFAFVHTFSYSTDYPYDCYLFYTSTDIYAFISEANYNYQVLRFLNMNLGSYSTIHWGNFLDQDPLITYISYKGDPNSTNIYQYFQTYDPDTYVTYESYLTRYTHNGSNWSAQAYNWSMPEHTSISGKALGISTGTEIILMDFQNNKVKSYNRLTLAFLHQELNWSTSITGVVFTENHVTVNYYQSFKVFLRSDLSLVTSLTPASTTLYSPILFLGKLVYLNLTAKTIQIRDPVTLDLLYTSDALGDYVSVIAVTGEKEITLLKNQFSNQAGTVSKVPIVVNTVGDVVQASKIDLEIQSIISNNPDGIGYALHNGVATDIKNAILLWRKEGEL